MKNKVGILIFLPRDSEFGELSIARDLHENAKSQGVCCVVVSTEAGRDRLFSYFPCLVRISDVRNDLAYMSEWVLIVVNVMHVMYETKTSFDLIELVLFFSKKNWKVFGTDEAAELFSPIDLDIKLSPIMEHMSRIFIPGFLFSQNMVSLKFSKERVCSYWPRVERVNINPKTSTGTVGLILSQWVLEETVKNKRLRINIGWLLGCFLRFALTSTRVQRIFVSSDLLGELLVQELIQFKDDFIVQVKSLIPTPNNFSECTFVGSFNVFSTRSSNLQISGVETIYFLGYNEASVKTNIGQLAQVSKIEELLMPGLHGRSLFPFIGLGHKSSFESDWFSWAENTVDHFQKHIRCRVIDVFSDLTIAAKQKYVESNLPTMKLNSLWECVLREACIA